MNILNKLTIKHLKMNKKRTLVTIIGIILSTALMVGIGLLVSSMLTTERMAMTKNYGSHHAYIENLTKSEYDTVSRNVNVKNTYYYTPLGYVKVESGLSSKPYLYVVEGSKELINNLKLVSGSLPTNSNEIVISEELTHFIDDYKVGDTVSFDLGVRISEGEELGIYHNYSVPMSWEEDVPKYIDEEFKVSETKTYKIVGIVERTSYEEYNAAGFMTFSLNSSKADIYNTYIEYKNPSKSYKYTEEIVSNVGLTDKAVKMNENLLYYYGATKYNNVNSTLLPLMIIALSVISVGCIIVIYNSFAISTMERKKSFGLYASIGTTPKQIKKTVLFEATLVGTIGIFLGVLGGFLGIYVVVQIINYLVADSLSMKILFSVDALYIIIPLIFMVAVILISAYLPAKRSSLVTPIEAIRGNDDIKIAKKDVKTPKYITKLFGIEGTIAHKNIKRNKKKYRVTIISLFISIVMFNTFTSFLNYFVKASDSFDYYDYDIQVVFYNDIDTAYSDINMLTNKYKTDKSLIIVNQDVLSVTNMKADDFTTQYQSIYLDDREEQDAGIGFGLIVLKDEDFRKITNKEAILLNNKYYTTYNDNERKTTELKTFSKNDYKVQAKYNDKDVSLEAEVINDNIYGLKQNMYSYQPKIVIGESTYRTKMGMPEEVEMTLLLSIKNYKEINDALKNKDITFTSKFDYFSPALEMAQAKNLVLAVKILFYGFIALVTLIGVTSVINTINTNINLRRKEFAMLRSVGLTPKGFNKLLFFESLFFGIKSLIYGIPVSMLINILISLSIRNVMDTSIIVPWRSFLICILAVFLIVLMAMNYAAKKIKRENILEALREENI